MTPDDSAGSPDALSPDLLARLPWNYFSVVQPGRPVVPRHILALPGPEDALERTEAPYAVASADMLANPAALARYLDEVFRPHGQQPTLFFGPPAGTTSQGSGFKTLSLSPYFGNVGPTVSAVAVIIDAGIAFWDPVFRKGDDPLFHEIAFLDFDADGAGNLVENRLGRAAITSYCTDAAGPAGWRAIMRDLADKYPASLYGEEGRADPGRGWHGTGVADLVAGGADPGDVALLGIELPRAILDDHDGDSLLANLALTVEMALAATQPLAGLPLVIVLPFGFVSGPQDGSHPVVAAVGRLLTAANRDVTLVVPAGNHRQDRCTARIEPGAQQPLVLRTPPDDFSPTAVEIVLDGLTGPDGRVLRELHLAPPGEAVTVHALAPYGSAPVLHRGRAVGTLHRRADTATGARFRLDLAGSARDGSGVPPAPAGDWRIGVMPGETAQLHILRDDRDLVADKASPHRAAVFADPLYRDTDTTGAPVMDDAGAGPVRRAGTASLLSTVPGVVAVQADERRANGPRRPAWYSGLRADGQPWPTSVLVDDGWPLRGFSCAANGTALRSRLSGTSAAAALHARFLLNLPARAPD